MMETRTETINAPVLEALEDLLLRETYAYQEVVDALKEKSKLLVEGNYHQLPQCDQTLLVLGQKTIHLEQERIQLMQQYSSSELSLNQLIYQLPAGNTAEPQKKRLQETRRNLLEAVEAIRLLNQDHRRLINQSAKWVNETLKLVQMHNAPESSSYQAQGKKTAAVKPHGTNPVQSTVIREA